MDEKLLKRLLYAVTELLEAVLDMAEQQTVLHKSTDIKPNYEWKIEIDTATYQTLSRSCKSVKEKLEGREG